jgi:hypothetical protein
MYKTGSGIGQKTAKEEKVTAPTQTIGLTIVTKKPIATRVFASAPIQWHQHLPR